MTVRAETDGQGGEAAVGPGTEAGAFAPAAEGASGASGAADAPATPTAAPEGADAPATPAAEPQPSDADGLLAAVREGVSRAVTPDAHDPGEAPKAEPAPGVTAEPGVTADANAEPAADDTDAAANDEADPSADALTAEERATASNAVQRKVGRLLRNVKRLQPDAVAYRNITRFMAANQLTGEDAARGFEVMAMIKAGSPKALDAIKPYLDAIQRANGATVDADLTERVQQGYLDEDTAREVTRMRAQTEAQQAAIAAQQTQQAAATQQAAERQAADLRGAIAHSLNTWEAGLANDPDYSVVRSAVLDYVKTSFAAKPPTSPADALERVRGIYDRLREVRAPRPAPAGVSRPGPGSVRPGPSSTLSPQRPPTREPQTMQEAIRFKLQELGAA